MKTEDLDIFEAYEALKNGYCVVSVGRENVTGYVHQYINSQLYYWNIAGDRLETRDFSADFNKVFRVVPNPDEEKATKALDFITALKLLSMGKTLMVQGPDDYTFYINQASTAVAVTVSLVDLAERRGWKITED